MATIRSVLLIGLLASLAAPPPAKAQPAQRPMLQLNGVSMPVGGGFSRRSGLAITVDPRWANCYGYVPVQVTVRALRPSATDRVITVELHSGSWNAQWGSMAVTQQVELPQGSMSATMTIDTPLYSQYQISSGYFWFDIFVDGEKDKYLSIDFGSFNTNPQQSGNVSFLAVGLNAPSRSPVVWNTAEYGLLPLTVGELPARWIEYTAFDVVTLSLSDLKSAAANNPQSHQALRRWVHAGGQMWISEVGQKWEQLSEVEKLLDLPAPARGEAGQAGQGLTDRDAEERGWQPVRPWPENWDGRTVRFTDRRTGAQISLRDPASIAQYSANRNYYVVEEKRTAAKTDEKQAGQPNGPVTNTSTRWFLDQPLGFGKVRVFRGGEVPTMWKKLQQASLAGQQSTTVVDSSGAIIGSTTNASATDPAATPAADPPPAVEMALDTTANWIKRHGLAPDTPNSEFADWLVPGVGLAPVTEFRILITLFVLLIGPVNYLLLKRYRRLYLLVLTVPLAAALLTAALFVYALASDGLDTKVRVRSFTMLDQRSGEAACWARLSYYAGLAPGRGLTIPGDTAIFPIVPDWAGGGSPAEVGGARRITWDADGAQLTRGWLHSRTPTQYLTVRSRKSPIGLQLRPGDHRLRAKNELQTAIRFVLVADASGNLFAGHDLADGASGELLPIESAAAARRFAELLHDHQPEPPPELSAAGRSPAVGWGLFGSPYYAYGYGNAGNSNLSENLQQEAFGRWMTASAEAAPELPPRSFVAITDTNPEVELGVAGAHEEASFHVIAGQW
jgi:hypothetical protein